MSSHWKDWMDFSHSERNGFLILIPLVILLTLLPRLYPLLIKKEKADFSKIENALALLEEAERIDSLERVNAYAAKKTESKEIENTNIELKPFNPNSASLEDFLNLGLSKKLAHTIINYREKGGRFYKKEDLQKTYGLSDADYSRLEDFIQIPDSWNERPYFDKEKKVNFKAVKEPKVVKSVKLIELNSADSLSLIQLKGIGPAFSSRILKYRNLLGGFRAHEQLLEVYGMDSLRWESLISQIRIDSNNIKGIDINSAEWIDLVRHPYIDKQTANKILQHRKYNGSFEDVSDLLSYYLLNKQLYRKIAPYLKANDRAEAKKDN